MKGEHLEHECQEIDYCTCPIEGLEPSEECPIHSIAAWPPRCGYCGRYMTQVRNGAVDDDLVYI